MGSGLSSQYIDDDSGASHAIGVILMVSVVVALASLVMVTVYAAGGSGGLAKTPSAIITIESVEGGIPDDVKYDENTIRLVHKAGDPLYVDSTSLVIWGEGSGFVGKVGFGGKKEYGHTMVSYSHLGALGKYDSYCDRNPMIQDNIWSAGEYIVLNGYDGDNTCDDISVHVTVNGFSNTSNHYGFKEGENIGIKLIDGNTQRIIFEGNSIVEHA